MNFQSTVTQKPSHTFHQPLRVLHFTDSHLLLHEDDRLKGTATWQTFRAVIEHAMGEGARPDFILATGDLVHDGPAIIYQRLQEYIAQFQVPIHVLPGNHDDPAVLAHVFLSSTNSNAMDNPSDGAYHSPQNLDPTGHTSITNTIDGEPYVSFGHARYGNWQIILLNTAVPQKQYGMLSDKELFRVESLLDNSPQFHNLLCLHHHPVPFGRAGLDSIGLRNADAFFAIVDRHHNVGGIVWGHIHSPFKIKRRGIGLFGTPSTCFQFDATSERISAIGGPPGYRWLTLESNGQIRSDVVWVTERKR